LTQLSHGLLHIARSVRNQLFPRVCILMYHRVADVPCDPFHLSVTPRHFAEHLEVIQRIGRLIPLRRLDRARANRGLAAPYFVVTCDDGYHDNLTNALPLLERYDAPATIFVTSGYVGGDREFWWDDLERMLLQPGALPATLDLSISGVAHHWSLGEASTYDAADQRRLAGWRFDHAETPTNRQRIFQDLYTLLKPLPSSAKRAAFAQLYTWSGVQETSRPSHRPLTGLELAALGRHPLIEIGGHSVTHPALGNLTLSEQDYEIRGGKLALEEMIEKPVESFAYPHGSHTSDTVDAVRASGFRYACAVQDALVRPRVDRFRLPRIEIRDYDGDTFSRRLDRQFRD
jgi:peptidoglycan/xylan/chitin deacetylase (PgdA/CDA1 family)